MDKDQGNTQEGAPVVELTDAQSRSSFLEGFNEDVEAAKTAPAPKEAPAAQPAAEAKPESKAAPAPAPAAAAEASPIPGLTMDQLKGILAKVPQLEAEVRTAHGKIGELNRELTTRQAAPAPAVASAPASKAGDPAKGGGDPDEFDPSTFDPAAFSKVYPEFALFVEKFADERAKGVPGGAAGSTRAEIVAQIHEDMLTMWQSDWKQVVRDNDYQLWLSTQTPELQKTAHETESAIELNSIITAFKASRDTAATGTTRSNRRRMEGAVVPGGASTIASPVSTEREQFLAGFESG